MILITDNQQLAEAAAAGGINVPANLDDFNLLEHIHFVIYATVQRGEELPYLKAAEENAKLIAALSEDEVKQVSIQDLIDKGFKFGPPAIQLVN